MLASRHRRSFVDSFVTGAQSHFTFQENYWRGVCTPAKLEEKNRRSGIGHAASSTRLVSLKNMGAAIFALIACSTLHCQLLSPIFRNPESGTARFWQSGLNDRVWCLDSFFFYCVETLSTSSDTAIRWPRLLCCTYKIPGIVVRAAGKCVVSIFRVSRAGPVQAARSASRPPPPRACFEGATNELLYLPLFSKPEESF